MRIVIITLIFFFSIFNLTYAFTFEEVKEHDNKNDCWIVFEDSVYDISPYIESHDKYLEIADWCGKDITQDFKDKGGLDRDHKDGSYNLLETFYIDKLEESNISDSIAEYTKYTSEITNEIEEEIESSKTSYNVIVPLILSLIFYWVPYFICKRSCSSKQLVKFNAFWNSILILLLLIPGVLFGIFMILRYRFDSLWNINFDFMYWHVELSLFMGLLATNHFLQRIKIYFNQLKK